jgi:hypothetical protein
MDLLLRATNRIVRAWEAQLRAALRLSLEPDTDPTAPVLRRGRAIGWLREALEPLAASRPDLDLDRLAVAIRSATGIEAFVWLVDVACCPREEALELMHGSGRAILQAALRTGGP